MAGKKRRKQGSQQGGSGRSGDAEGRASSRRAQRAIHEREAKKNKLIKVVGGALGVAVVVAGVLILFNLGGGSDEPISNAPEMPDVPTDELTMGNPDAPVTVVEYGDFQ